MRRKIWILGGLAAVASVASVAVVQADGTAAASSLSPPAIHEPFTPGPCPPRPVSTPQLLGCIEKRLLETDEKINQLNAAIFAELNRSAFVDSSKRRVLRRFRASHRAWLAYRNSNCLDMWAGLEEGTLFPVAVGECEVTLNRQRIQSLRTLMRFPEG